MENNKFFQVIKEAKDCKARAGKIITDHGEINTPIFMPVGTVGTVKAIDQKSLVEINAQIILGNTYHLYLRPSTQVIQRFGGLHKFIHWDKPILTDSGGYQVFSLKELRKLTEEGVEFRSHIDGSKHFFSPEKVIEIERYLGSDIIMPLDECTSYPAEHKVCRDSMDLTLRWLERTKTFFNKTAPIYGHKQFLFSIGQGGIYQDLRAECLLKQIELDLDGYAIGGLSVGEPADIMYDIVDVSTDIIPANKPRYLMGVGTPENILEAVERGIDMFDCVMPTRNARNGQIFTTRGKINIKNAKYKMSDELIDEELNIYPSNFYTLGYLRHLFHNQEILGLMIATHQNLAFYLWLIQTARQKILCDEYRQWKKTILNKFKLNAN